MSDLGSQLRLAREAKGLSLEQVFKATRIKSAYIEALESNRIDALPGIVQARGFVRSYANYLGLNGEALASTLDTGHLIVATPPAAPIEPAKPIGQPTRSAPIEADHATVRSNTATPAPATLRADRAHVPVQSTSKLRAPAPSTPSSTKSRPATMGGFPTPLLIVGAVVLFVVGLLLIATALSSGPKAPLPASATSTENKVAISSVTAPTRSIASGPLSLTLVASEHVWLRVTLDGQTAFEGLLDPNVSQTWTADDQVIVETGNAGAITVAYNGQAAVLGNRGQVVARAWSHTGVDTVPVAAPDHASDLPSQPTSVATTTLKP
jgi:cytoskeletal protein RodZ